MEIFRSKDADQDLREIYIFTRRTRGERQAERYFARLNRCLEFVAEQPMSAQLRSEFTPHVRVHMCGSHMLIYTVVEDRIVFVVRILHSRMNIAGRLPEEFLD